MNALQFIGKILTIASASVILTAMAYGGGLLGSLLSFVLIMCVFFNPDEFGEFLNKVFGTPNKKDTKE